MATNITDYESTGVARSGDAPVKYRPPQRLQGKLAPQTVIAANDVNGIVVNVLGTGRIRIAAKVSAAGTLRVRWRLADHLTNVATPASNPDDPGTALVGGTELVRDYPNNPGMGEMEVAVVNGAGASTVSYIDVFMTDNPN